MKQQRPDVTAIIVNYNTTALLQDALDSLFAHTSGVWLQTIVVDNASPQGDPKIELAERYGDRVEWLSLAENVGFGRANNAAMERAKGKYFFLLNPDTLLRNNAVERLYKYMEANPKVGVCGGNVYQKELSPGISYKYFAEGVWFELDALFNEPIGRLCYGRSRVFNHRGRPLSVAAIVGADMMVRCAVWEKLGGFDPDFFMYAEEIEWQHRIRKAGWRIMSVPDAEIIHLEGGSYEQSERRLEAMLKGKVLLYQKCFSPFALWAMLFLRRLMMRSRIGVLRRINRPETLAYHRTMLRLLKQIDAPLLFCRKK